MATAVGGLLAVRHRRAGHRVLPDDLLRLLPDRPRHRQRVHAAADARDGRRPGRRRRARLRDHQRLPADQRRARTRRPQHRRRQPHEGTAVRRQRAHELADRRLPRRLPGRSRRHRRRDRPRVRAPAPARPGAADRRGPDRPHPRPPASPWRNKPHDALADSRYQRIRLVSDAVVANYIHDISARTGSGAAPGAGAPTRRPGRSGRPARTGAPASRGPHPQAAGTQAV